MVWDKAPLTETELDDGKNSVDLEVAEPPNDNIGKVHKRTPIKSTQPVYRVTLHHHQGDKCNRHHQLGQLLQGRHPALILML